MHYLYDYMIIRLGVIVNMIGGHDMTDEGGHGLENRGCWFSLFSSYGNHLGSH